MLKAARAEGKTAVLYLRRSYGKQDQSLGTQRKICLKYAQENGTSVIREYVDDSKSGTSTRRRNDFNQLMADAQRPDRDFDAIIVTNVSRFSRGDIDEVGYYRFILRRNGVQVLYANENFRGDPSDDIIRSVKQSEAHQKCIDLSRDTLDGQLQRAEQGWWNGGTPPWGYDLEYVYPNRQAYMTIRFREDGTREATDHFTRQVRTVAPKEQFVISKSDRCRLVFSQDDRVALIRRIFDLCTRRAFGYRRIVNELNREEIRSPKGGRWSIGTIRAILRNRIYVGDMVWNRRANGKYHVLAGGELTARTDAEFEQLKLNGEGDWIIVKDAHQPIVARAQFEEAQRLIEQRNKSRGSEAFRHGRAMNSDFLLTGLMRCTRCGHNLIGETISGGKVRKDGTRIVSQYYVCAGYKSKGNAVCERAAVKIQDVHEGILSSIACRVGAMLSNGGIDRLRDTIASELKSEIPNIGAEIAAAERIALETRAKIDNLLESLTPINKEFVDPKLLELKSRRKAQDERLRELKAMKQEEVDVDGLADEIVATVKGFGDLFNYGTPEEKKAFIRLWIDRIDFHPEKRRAEVYIKRFPAPSQGTGNSSFRLVAGARYEPATLGADAYRRGPAGIKPRCARPRARRCR